MNRENSKCEQVHQETANVLLVGDRVNLFADQPGAAFGWATVVCVGEDTVELVRPYIHTSSNSYASQGGTKLIDYVGQERIKLDRKGPRVLTVVFRSQVPE